MCNVLLQSDRTVCICGNEDVAIEAIHTLPGLGYSNGGGRLKCKKVEYIFNTI